MNFFINIAEKNAGVVAGTIKDEEAAGYLKWCKKEVSKRVDEIVGNKCNESCKQIGLTHLDWIRSLQRVPKWYPLLIQSETTKWSFFFLRSLIRGPH